jgi:hypothetical protein
MYNRLLVILGACTLLFSTSLFAQPFKESDREMVRTIFEQSLETGHTYDNLEYLCLKIGPRLSGSEGADKAVAWTKELMESYGFDRVYLQEVMVPHWERGPKEEVYVVEDGKQVDELAALAIGGSVPTPDGGLEAEVIEVYSLEEVEELGRSEIEGKIVFYARAFDQKVIQTGAGYGGAVDQRTAGPSKAAEYGAVGVIIRSVASNHDDNPHTGTLRYRDDVPKIPAAALGVQSAERLQAMLKENPSLKVRMKINSVWYEDKLSHNVIGEIKGSEFPDEIILVGGHLDSWDVSQGAHDDGAGCIQSIEVLRLLKEMNYQPKRTLRAVMFMNEENGLRGGMKYAEVAKELGENHIMAIESDAGGFTPRGFGVSGPDALIEKCRSWLPLFNPNTVVYFNKGGGGADVGPLHRETGAPMAGLSVDSQRMFDLHHAPTDNFDTVNRRELHLGSASMAAFVYLLDQYGGAE